MMRMTAEELSEWQAAIDLHAESARLDKLRDARFYAMQTKNVVNDYNREMQILTKRLNYAYGVVVPRNVEGIHVVKKEADK